jgi:uncharacterized protein (TIGR02145 family)/uncharacterized repeat protein (TIGR02543 family)
VYQTQKIPYNGQATLPATPPVLTGYSFEGWYTTNDVSGVSFDFSSSVTVNRTLYAKWAQVYSVTYFANGGSGSVPTDSKKYKAGESVTVLAKPTDLVNSGYSFTGWTLNTQGTGTLYSSAEKITIGSGDVNLYAQWTLIPKYTITYNSNGSSSGAIPVDANQYEANSNVVVKGNTGNLQRNGSSFSGWNTNADGNGTGYAAGANLTMGSANVILYAQWSILQCQVSFNTHGGTAVASQTVNYRSLLTEPASTLTALTLVVWYTDAGYTNRWDFSTSVTSAMTLHAKWEVRDRDGNTYDTVRIGTQTWMVQNLRTTKYNDGTPITKVEDMAEWANRTSEAFSWVNGLPSTAPMGGILYNYYAAESDKIAPKGWHVPSLDEWNTLNDYLTANGYNADGQPDYCIAKALSAKSVWNTTDEPGTPGNDPSKNNKTNFSAFPSGWRGSDGTNVMYGEQCLWWARTVLSATLSFTPRLEYNMPHLHTTFICDVKCGINIRCIKDQ